MADNCTAAINEIKEHLDEHIHVFKDQHTDRLCVSGWDRNTVADGNWLNINTIRPLSARDVYLAECLENISASQIVYTEGEHIVISAIPNEKNKFQIGLSEDFKPYRYNFGKGFTVTPVASADSDSDKYDVKVKVKTDDEFLKLDDDTGALYCNAEEIANYTLTKNYVSATVINETKTNNYTYVSADPNLEVVRELPSTILESKIYLIGGN